MDEMHERMKDPLFCVDLAMRYHGRRWNFINHLENWTLFLAAIAPPPLSIYAWKWFLGTDGKIEFPWWLIGMNMLYLVAWFIVCEKTSGEDPWTRTKFSRRHRDAKRRFGEINRKLMFAKDGDEIASAVDELAIALRDNPLRLKVLTAITYNECLVAREYLPSLLRISLWQRIMASWCDVHAESIVPIRTHAPISDRQGTTNSINSM